MPKFMVEIVEKLPHRAVVRAKDPVDAAKKAMAVFNSNIDEFKDVDWDLECVMDRDPLLATVDDLNYPDITDVYEDLDEKLKQ